MNFICVNYTTVEVLKLKLTFFKGWQRSRLGSIFALMHWRLLSPAERHQSRWEALENNTDNGKWSNLGNLFIFIVKKSLPLPRDTRVVGGISKWISTYPSLTPLGTPCSLTLWNPQSSLAGNSGSPRGTRWMKQTKITPQSLWNQTAIGTTAHKIRSRPAC